MFYIKSKEILSKTSFQEATSAPKASNQGVENGHISFDLLQNMTFHEKTEVFKNETVKKTLVLIAKTSQQQKTHFAGPNFSLGKSDVFEIYMLKCSLFLRKYYDFENPWVGDCPTTIIIKKE